MALISHAQLYISHDNAQNPRLQQYVNQDLPNVQAGFRKCRGTRDQNANICWIIEKVCFADYIKAFDCVDNNKLWKIL